MTEQLTEEQIEQITKIQAYATNQIMSNKGNISFLQNAIDKFVQDLKEQNKECEPKAYMMAGAIIGYSLCLINKGGVESGNIN